VPPNPNALGSSMHFRRESNHSIQSDNNPGGPNRGNFPPQGGRGRGYNPHGNSYNNQMGYPPNNQFRNGPGQGRGMPPPFQPQPRNMPYPNSPQPNHRSPALVPSMPGTPNMPPANMPVNMSMQTPPQYHYPPPMANHAHQQVCNPFPGPVNKPPLKHSRKTKPRRDGDKFLHQRYRSNSARELFNNDLKLPHRRPSKRADQSSSEQRQNSTQAYADQSARKNTQQTLIPAAVSFVQKPSLPLDMSPGNYEQLLLTAKTQSFGYPPQQMDQYGRGPYGYNMQYMPPPQTNSPGYNPGFVPTTYHQSSHSMSRTPSQPERPSSANQQAPPVAMGSNNKQPNVPTPSSSFVKPRKSAAIQIKTESGDIVDTSSLNLKLPASPAPTGQSKTPPVVASTPTPPPKSSTPGHARTDSQATQKTAKQIQDELKEKIKQATQGPQDKAKDEKSAQASSQTAPGATPTASAETKAEPAAAAPAATPPAEAPVEKPVEKPAETAPAAKEEPTKKAEEPKPAAPAASDEPDEDEIERMIREMEEADAKREKEEEEHQKRRAIEKAAAAAKAEEDRKTNAAEEDRKLREQEREMERLEEEKERKRAEAEKSGKAVSLAEALAGADSTKVDSVTDKLASMKIDGDKPTSPADSTGQKPTTAEKRGAKPAALNLTPLNTKPVEPPQPSAALQSLKSARFLQVMDQNIYPAGINSPNPALNAAVTNKGKTFKYDANFLLQFQKVFTEQPSLEFHQQVKTLIGDGDGGRSASGRVQTPGSARSGSRGGGAGFSMGTFNAPRGGLTLPPGTNSAERFAMANNPLTRAPSNPVNSFNRPGGAFPMSGSISRSGSQSNMAGNNSGRQGSRNTRGSRRNDYNAKEAQAAKTMPLTAGMELKPITTSATGWKPLSVGNKAAASATATGHMDPETVQRKVKAALNKMTPENFDRISEQILTIASQSKDETDGRTLRQVIQLTFEKATDEAHWASMYAKFCKKMLETMNPEIKDERIKDRNGNVVSGGNLFRKYLLNRCQEEFERGWSTNIPEPEEKEGGKPGEAAMLSEEYYIAAAAKRRGLGLVQFIGELYKLGMLTERIMLECVHKLVDYKGVPDEAEIESLSKLLRTVGGNLDMSEKGRPMMDVYFGRIQQMLDMPELPSRMKFMLMDVLDLRKANWVSKETNKGPKTLEEVRAEVSNGHHYIT
jgi:translation initiation factor 4G